MNAGRADVASRCGDVGPDAGVGAGLGVGLGVGEIGRLAAITRYPLKGFAGQRLGSTEVVPGRGIPYDRCLAITNGTETVDPTTDWVACAAFIRLFRNSELPLFTPDFDIPAEEDGRPAMALTSPDGDTLRLRMDDDDSLAAVNATLAGWFRSGPVGPPRLVRTRAAFWDYQDGALSLINLNTLAELAEEVGRPVDPRRFRGNLYISGLPAWEELALVGRRIRIGGVEIEVMRPIDRCRATAVDPDTAATDLNVPALLGRRFGHIYCGVYARVVGGGRLSVGQPIGDAGLAAVVARPTVHAPSPERWPRPARIVGRMTETDTVTSLWLHDPLASVRARPRPGQHLRLHVRDEDGPVWRCYTISGVEGASGDRMRISVKRQGRMSALLHRAATEGDALVITGPYGEVTLDDDTQRPLLLISAGVGITPTIAMLAATAERAADHSVTVLHVARDATDLALWEEACDLVRRLPGGRIRLHLTRPKTDDCARHGARHGRPDKAVIEDIAAEVPITEATAYLCGPTEFMGQMRSALQDAGMSDDRIHQEAFASPGTVQSAAMEPPSPGPFKVHFSESGLDAIWRRESGSLLDVAEDEGLALPSGCRAGACESCAQSVMAGRTTYLSEPATAPPAGTVLLCSAVPTTDITIQA